MGTDKEKIEVTQLSFKSLDTQPKSSYEESQPTGEGQESPSSLADEVQLPGLPSSIWSAADGIEESTTLSGKVFRLFDRCEKGIRSPREIRSCRRGR
jgi:hypothetical protein